MIYEFTITRNYQVIEDFEKNDSNVASLEVFDQCGSGVSGQVRYITMFLSKNAMLGLGTELIRLAHNFEEGKEIHIIPASLEKGAQESMGVFLTPDSCELIIKCKSFGTVDEVLEEYKLKHT